MVPIILGLSTNIAGYYETNLSVTEKDVINKMFKIDLKTIRSVENSNNVGYDDVYLRDRVRNYIKRWEKETMFLSDINKIVGNDNFKQIISLGEKAAPFILEELNEKPSHIVWALNLIFGRQISNQQLSIKDASKAWVRWGIQNKLITNAFRY